MRERGKIFKRGRSPLLIINSPLQPGELLIISAVLVGEGFILSPPMADEG